MEILPSLPLQLGVMVGVLKDNCVGCVILTPDTCLLVQVNTGVPPLEVITFTR